MKVKLNITNIEDKEEQMLAIKIKEYIGLRLDGAFKDDDLLLFDTDSFLQVNYEKLNGSERSCIKRFESIIKRHGDMTDFVRDEFLRIEVEK